MPSRTLKDGSTLALQPDTRVSFQTVPKPNVLSSEQLQERATVAEAAINAYADPDAAPVSSPVASSLEHGKSGRGALATRRTTEFTEWRTQTVSGAKNAIKARAVAMLRIKQAEEAARLAAEEAARLAEEAVAAEAAAAASASHAPAVEAVVVS